MMVFQADQVNEVLNSTLAGRTFDQESLVQVPVIQKRVRLLPFSVKDGLDCLLDFNFTLSNKKVINKVAWTWHLHL